MQRHAGLKHGVIFAPSVVPAYRGMVVEVPLHLGAMDGRVTADRLRAGLQEFYAGSPMVTVPMTRAARRACCSAPTSRRSDGMALHVRGDAEGNHVRLIAMLDNLGKGASGAAIQSLNLMCGLPETRGLRLASA